MWVRTAAGVCESVVRLQVVRAVTRRLVDRDATVRRAALVALRRLALRSDSRVPPSAD